jgi:hypothetical protein
LEVVTNCDHLKRLRFSPNLPYAFTEHGAIMAASVLNTPRAIDVSVYVVRTFIKLRDFLGKHHELVLKLAELERKVNTHDESIRRLLAAIQQLMAPAPEKPKGRIGFRTRARKPSRRMQSCNTVAGGRFKDMHPEIHNHDDDRTFLPRFGFSSTLRLRLCLV